MQEEMVIPDVDLSGYYPRIKVVGIGGAGNNIIDYITKQNIEGAETIAINTDAAHLRMIKATKKLVIGKGLTKGRGAGGDPEKGRLAAQESLKEIKELLKDSDLVFLLAGLGGGTGTGASPIIAQIAKENGALTIAFVIMPMKYEGARVLKAIRGLNKLRDYCNTVVVIDNERLVSRAGNLPIYEAFNVANNLVASMIGGLVETIMKPSMVNLDFADLKAIMDDGDVAVIGLGESDSENRSIEAVKRAIEHPLLDVELKDCTGALVHITGGPDMRLDELSKVCNFVRKFLNPDAQLTWGARIEKEFEKKIRVVTIITGVKSPYILGPLKKKKIVEPRKDEDIGIEFI